MTDSARVSDSEVEQWFDEESEEEEEDLAVALPADPAAKYAESQLRVVRETKDYQFGLFAACPSAGPRTNQHLTSISAKIALE
jgi:hypothetical protein